MAGSRGRRTSDTLTARSLLRPKQVAKAVFHPAWIVFILGAPVTVTAIAALEMNRLRRRYGIRLGAHPATLPTPRPMSPPVRPPR
ncbi:hypothetical protein [Streptomyces sp. NPDC005141]